MLGWRFLRPRDWQRDRPRYSDVPELLAYAGYNAELSRGDLDALGLEPINPVHVQQMDSVGHIGEMQEAGQRLARQKVKAERFSGFPAASWFSYFGKAQRRLAISGAATSFYFPSKNGNL